MSVVGNYKGLIETESQRNIPMSNSNAQVVEIVTFSLNADANADAYLAISQKSGDWAKAHPGFVSRQLARGEDGVWTDITVWDNAENAKASQASFMEQDFAMEMIGMIEKDSFSMHQRPIIWQQG
jgi:hypothetical protein